MNDNAPEPHSAPLIMSGLSLADIAELLCEHGQFIGSTVGRYSATFNNGDLQDASDFAGELLIQSPDLIAHAIAKSSGCDASIVGRLPAGTQLEALAELTSLTLAGCSPADVFAQLASAVAPLKPCLGLTRH